jgi:ribosomal protein S12 methylthiotransferase accessory factor
VAAGVGAPGGVALAPAAAGAGAAFAAAHGRVVVTLHWYPDRAELAEVLAGATAAGRAWVPVVLRAAEAVVGPAWLPGHSGSALDAVDREVAAAAVPEVVAADYRRPERGREPSAAEIAAALFRGLDEAALLAAGKVARVAGNQIRIAFADGAQSLHPVLPLPAAGMAPYRNDSLVGERLILDDRTGIVTRIIDLEFPPQAPPDIAGLVATAADLVRIGPWPNSIVNGSVAIGRPVEQMRAAAVGEAVERYCGSLPLLAGTRFATYNELRAAGEQAVDPRSLVLFAPEHYREPGFPFVPFSRDLRVRWARGISTSRGGEPTWVPASVVWTNYHVGERAAETPVNPPLFAGVAAGRSVPDAACAALEEILERHAVMVWWMHGQRLPLVGTPTAQPGRWPHWSLLVRNIFNLPVIATVVRDPVLDLACVGSALRPNVAECTAKSLAEGASNMVCNADLLDPDGAFWSAVRSGEKDMGYLKPYRADRRYLDSFAADFRDVGDLEAQLQVHCDPRATAQALRILEPDGVADLAGLHQDFPRTLDGYRRIIEPLGYQVVVVDLTTPDVAHAGYHVVRVVVPGLVSNFGAGFPLTGNGAIGRDGPLLGWRETPLEPSGMTLLPLPHA